MAPASRSALFAKIHKILKKVYKPVLPPGDRSVLEHLLFACCLEDARYEAAEEAFAALVHTFFDWNEVRVTSISELSEVMSALPDPRAAANRIKRILHGIFEELYSFDLEEKKKKNLGPTIKWLEKIDGTTKFSVAYVVQAALGGHSIPVDTGTLRALQVLDLVTDKELISGEVSGMERAVAKSKGQEFGSFVHQLGADFTANPFSPEVRDLLLQIDPDAAKRFPQRRVQREVKPPAKVAAPKAAAEPAPAEPPPTTGRKKKSEAAAPAAPAAAAPAKPAAGEGKKSGKKHSGDSAPAEKHEKADKKAPDAKEPTAEGLAKRKPR